MDGFLIFLAFVGCFIVFGAYISVFIILGRTGTIIDKLEALQKKFTAMGNELAQVKSELIKVKSEGISTKPEEKKVIQEELIPPPVIIPEIKKEIIHPPIEETKEEVKKEPVLEHTNIIDSNIRIEVKDTQKKTIPLVKKPKEPSFFEKNPDLEKFIGENLINKIGIAILVIGIGFFVKFAIDKDWINEIGRVLIGILCGGILVGFAHYTRNNFRSFSSVLVGGGMAIFYITIAIAFHNYKIMPQSVAFIIMVFITIFSVLLSIAYDRKELAVLAIIGGFASPFMVSTGSGNYQVLFTYVLILNVGMLALSYFKRWNVVNVISFVFTIVLYGAWLTKVFTTEGEVRPYMGAMLFATLFYLTFFIMNIINNVKENKKFLAFEISILLANTFLYFSAGMLILRDIQTGIYQGLFTAILAVFNFMFAYFLYKNKKVDSNLVYLLIGLVLTFVTLAAPIQLEGNYITLFWAAETVLLLWLSQKSGIRIMKLGSGIIMCLMLGSLVMDWNNIYSYSTELIPIVFNKAFITSLVAMASISAVLFLLRFEEEKIVFNIEKKIFSGALELSFILVSYFGGLLEVYFQFDSRLALEISMYGVAPIYTGCYNLSYIVLISVYVHFKKVKLLEIFPVILCGIISIFYLTYYSQVQSRILESYLQAEPLLAKHYYFHYVNVILLLLILANALRIISTNFPKTTKQFNYFLWFLCFVVVFVASTELEHIVVVSSFAKGIEVYTIKHQNYKVGFPILWGICSFVLMFVGMKLKIKTLRIISLTLFGITLIKMAVFDFQEMSEGGKIAAFISLGVILLVTSFMYQKVKKILTEE